jgi:thymidine phosphorylase
LLSGRRRGGSRRVGTQGLVDDVGEQAGAGVELHAKPGDHVRRGEPLCTLHTDTSERFVRAEEALVGAYEVIPEEGPPDMSPLVIDRVGGG